MSFVAVDENARKREVVKWWRNVNNTSALRVDFDSRHFVFARERCVTALIPARRDCEIPEWRREVDRNSSLAIVGNSFIGILTSILLSIERSDEMEDTSSILLMSKIGAMIGLGFGSLAMGTLPLMVGRYRTKKQLQKRRRAISCNHSSTSTSTASSVDATPAADKQVRPKARASPRGDDNYFHRFVQHLRKAHLCADDQNHISPLEKIFNRVATLCR